MVGGFVSTARTGLGRGVLIKPVKLRAEEQRPNSKPTPLKPLFLGGYYCVTEPRAVLPTASRWRWRGFEHQKHFRINRTGPSPGRSLLNQPTS